MLIFSFIGICLTCRSNKAQTIKQVPFSENENHKETRNINATRENVTPAKKKISTITSPLTNVNREYTIRKVLFWASMVELPVKNLLDRPGYDKIL